MSKTDVQFSLGGSGSIRQPRGNTDPEKIQWAQAQNTGNLDEPQNSSCCETIISFDAHGSYAFFPKTSPNIEFHTYWDIKVIAKGKVRVTLFEFGHDNFPNYEAFINSTLVYSYDTTLPKNGGNKGPTLWNLNNGINENPRRYVDLDLPTPEGCP